MRIYDVKSPEQLADLLEENFAVAKEISLAVNEIMSKNGAAQGRDSFSPDEFLIPQVIAFHATVDAFFFGRHEPDKYVMGLELFNYLYTILCHLFSEKDITGAADKIKEKLKQSRESLNDS